jgi:UDP-N-acetylglucosamine 1-carboxyvinyltransferase
MGAKIKGAGTDIIEIQGVKNLKDVSYNIMPDRIETGTFLCMAAMTGGEILVKEAKPDHITPVLNKLEETGCKLKVENNEIQLQAPKRLKAVDIKTMPYPGFPTDMQSIFSTTLTLAKGTSMIVENLFENRYKYTQELIRMGAKISIEGKTAVIKGVRKLYGANVKATDLRGGAALVMAGMAAKGDTRVENIEYILRGYEGFDRKLKGLGVDIRVL